jgi:hypothetical protein
MEGFEAGVVSIEKGAVLHSEPCRGIKLRLTRFVQRVKTFDVISTGDHGAAQSGILEMMNKIEEQDFRSVYGKWMVEVWGLNRDDIGSSCQCCTIL